MSAPTRSTRRTKGDYSLQKMALGGIGSFLLVLIFPHGVRYFFRNCFAEMARDIVVITLAGLLTQKLAEFLSRHARPIKRSPF